MCAFFISSLSKAMDICSSFGIASVTIVVARSSLRAIAFVSARCASLRLTSIAPTHAAVASVVVVVARSLSRGCRRVVVVAWLSSRGRRRIVVARSSLRAITFVSARCASLQLTSIAPTHAAVASVVVVVVASSLRRCRVGCGCRRCIIFASLSRRLRGRRKEIRPYKFLSFRLFV
jgi:hypothetical protein